ncbi:hypothetical protein [Rhodococcus globerulus]|uniref:Uncharacterized protein n=1 Tax=Rhodococcus globerulus TaxID=33008 RepID=A0ABU4BU79_RHOGO|nr:hypothetical protein [Rhodococcus globerulus]MDV6267777.1 hypothetical protein [Rhodococcus globerulus]
MGSTHSLGARRAPRLAVRCRVGMITTPGHGIPRGAAVERTRGAPEPPGSACLAVGNFEECESAVSTPLDTIATIGSSLATIPEAEHARRCG